MTRRIIAPLLALPLAVSLAFAAAEAEEPAPWMHTGPMPDAVYTGVTQATVRLRAEMSGDAEVIGYFPKDATVKILSYEPAWLEVAREASEGWIKGYIPRQTVDSVKPVKEGAMPYGSLPSVYTATASRDTMLRDAPSEGAEAIFAISKGARLAIISIEEGWAKLLYWRQYGYVYADVMKDLTPVYDVESAQAGDVISAFVSFFATDSSELTQNRVTNIAQACEYISILMNPEDRFSFNGVAGPYQSGRGYKKAMSYYKGLPALSTGGGCCQVSSTLYNALLCIPDGMEVIYRRAHGPAGAVYLPHGTDAASGSEQLDLVFRNACPFPVRIDAQSHDGVLYIAMVKEQAVQ
ncbi:MAG: VanW family protein [Firmicutes bacterium]|nr:VanW family protein [Bacillota bacterium]